MLSSSTADNLKLHLLLEQAQDGSAIASVQELLDYRIEAPTNEQAIAQLKNLVTHLLVNAQLLPLDISMLAAEGTENPWMKYAGVFKDDPYFAKIVEMMQAERRVDDDEMDEVR